MAFARKLHSLFTVKPQANMHLLLTSWAFWGRFNLPHATQPLGLPLGQHITVKGIDPDGKEVMRPYTPVTDLGTRGYVEFVIKVSSSA